MNLLRPRIASTAGLLMLAGGPLLIVSGSAKPALALQQSADTPIRSSRLTGLALAPGAKASGDSLAGVAQKLDEFARKTGLEGVDAGSVEMFGWEGAGAAPRKSLIAALERAGYRLTEHEVLSGPNGKITPLTLTGSKDTLFGMWIESGAHLILAWGRAEGGADSPAVAPAQVPARAEASAPASADAIQLEVPASTHYINVMKGVTPRIPQFPMVAKKPGFVRGYVYDSNGKPLKGAKLGVRSTAVGGFYSGNSGVTDAKGYYEVQAPAGVGHFYCAGYAVDYGEGLAAMSLHPVDGAGTFATAVGEVKNFVWLPYGISDRAKAQDQPAASSSYYGGSVVLNWNINDSRPIFADPKHLPNNATIEFTLTPTGPLVDGGKGRAISVRKTVTEDTSSQLYINNIPACSYQVSAKLVGGGALKLREVGPYGNRPFGLEPKQATGKAELTFRPGTADPGMVPAAHGGWGQISLQVER